MRYPLPVGYVTAMPHLSDGYAQFEDQAISCQGDDGGTHPNYATPIANQLLVSLCSDMFRPQGEHGHHLCTVELSKSSQSLAEPPLKKKDQRSRYTPS